MIALKIVIDRIEGEFAVCELENGEFINAPLKLFPDIRDGDVIDISVDRAETDRRKAEAKSRLSSLFSKN